MQTAAVTPMKCIDVTQMSPVSTNTRTCFNQLAGGRQGILLTIYLFNLSIHSLTSITYYTFDTIWYYFIILK